MRLLRCPLVAFVVVISTGCHSRNDTTSPVVSAPMSSSQSPPPAPSPPPSAAPAAAGVELETKTPVVFEVRPTGGPKTMGPTVLSPKSDAALEEVRAYLLRHPDATPLRIECAASPTAMSSSPSTRWPASLALQVAHALVDRGIDCKRLEVVGWLDSDPNAPPERVRFFVGGAPARAASPETRLDACAR